MTLTALAIYILLGALGIYGLVVALFGFYVAVMALKVVRDNGRLTTTMKVFGYPLLIVGLFTDLFVNLFVATWLFLYPPLELTVSRRLTKYIERRTDWRATLALGICTELLDPFDPSGKHRV